MNRRSNNNNSTADDKKIIPDHENKNYEAVPKDYIDWRQDKKQEMAALPDHLDENDFHVLPDRHDMPDKQQVDKTTQAKRIIIPLVIFFFVLLAIILVWIFIGNFIKNFF